MRGVGLLVLAVVLGLVVGAPALADVVHLKSGRTLEGEVTDKGDEVEVKLKYGTTTIKKEEIDHIEKVQTPADVYAERAAALKPDDADGHLQLARWCRGQGLEEEARAALLKAVDIDPDHAQARADLGHLKVDDAWVDTTVRAVVQVTNPQEAALAVLVAGERVALVEPGATAGFQTAVGRQAVEVVVGEDRKLQAQVTFAPRVRLNLSVPDPQPEHVLPDSDEGFYVDPADVTDFVYLQGRCLGARLNDGALLGMLDGSAPPAPEAFDTRDLGDSLGLTSLYSQISDALTRRRPAVRADLTGVARVMIASKLFLLLDKDEAEDLEKGELKLRAFHLLCQDTVRYGPIQGAEPATEFLLSERGDLEMKVGALLLKAEPTALTVRPTGRTRGDYVIPAGALVRLVPTGRGSVLTIEEGTAKPVVEPGARLEVRPVRREGQKPRMPSGALAWSPKGYSLTRSRPDGSTEELLFGPDLVVSVTATPL